MSAFSYSEEEGTFGATHFRDRVTRAQKQARLEALMRVQNGISFAYNQGRIGSEVRVLCDAFHDGILVCRSEFESPEVDGEILVRYDPKAFGERAPQSLPGRFLRVRITAADEYDLTADLLEIID